MDIALGSPQHSQINFKGHDCSSGLAVPHSNWPPHPGLREIRLSVFTVALGTLLPNTKIPISLCKASLQLWRSSQKRLVTDTNQTAGPVSALNYWYSTIVNLSRINEVAWIYNYLCQHLSIKVGEVSVPPTQTEAKARSLVAGQGSQCNLATVRYVWWQLEKQISVLSQGLFKKF